MTFEDIVKQHNGLIFKIINKYSVKGYEKEDLYQEAITKLYEEYNNYNDEFKFTTFMYPILDNHMINLSKESQTQKRTNHIKGHKIKDTKKFDLTRLVQQQSYNKLELDILAIHYDLLNKQTKRNQDIITMVLDNYTLDTIGQEFRVSKQRISQIFKDYVKKIKEEMK